MFDHAVHFCFCNWGNCCTIAYTQHKPDYGAVCEAALNQFHTQAYFICSAYAFHMRYASGAEAARTHCAFTQEYTTLIRGCLPQTKH